MIYNLQCMRYHTCTLVAFLLLSLLAMSLQANNPVKAELPEPTPAAHYQLYNDLSGEAKPSFTAFTLALQGYQALEAKAQRAIITVIDFSLPSSEKRMWIIDLEEQVILHHTYVAHGKNTGTLMAKRFSNIPQSLQSSLGFYQTDNVYYGKHGRSLRLNGLESGINDKARERAIVLHGADYATEAFVKRQGRLGRSFGCPAVPRQETDAIIDWIKEGTLLFIYHPNPEYLAQSVVLQQG